ncbi:glycerol-3-phosphate 1-O-acyltransferase PlsY [Pararhodobacter zhoushanensis]|uniref:glycerol-3-phosphate 1-O-acyltransferase PlsY n=1 Tax=Pararhodobacter zhoushanensis TaxID=2479545 RepID=UPI000F8DBB22|nr:glycerol-3-phosphate 1-O-acyltransferase PlsY [Pararhodobacter zhoushanensis]
MLPDLTTAPLLLIAIAIGSYLLGSIPFGVVITKAMGLGDVRAIGSGNIGATNVLRTGNKPAALATLLLDAAKGAVAVLIARAVAGEDAAQVAALMSFLGHLFPVWLGFKGGKGVATFLGTLLALAWPIGLACCATWLVALAVTRISSASALVASAAAALYLWIWGPQSLIALAVVLAALVWVRHAANIARLMNGTEPKVGRKKS